MRKILTLLLLFQISIKSQISWDETFNFSNTPLTTSDFHSVHSDSLGNYYVVWSDSLEIKFKHSSDWGETWTDMITILPWAGDPIVKSDSNYVYVVAFRLENDYELIFRSSSDYGETWNPIQLPVGANNGAREPNMSIYESNIYLVWGQDNEIYFKKSTDQGLTWLETKNLSNSPGFASADAKIKATDNYLYCFWMEATNPGFDIFFTKSTDSGNTWSVPKNITNNLQYEKFYLTTSPNEEIFLAYSSDYLSDDIYLMYSNDGGINWSVPSNLTNNTRESITPCIEFFGNNLFFLWADNSHVLPYEDNFDIFLKWSSNNGDTWQDSINLSDNYFSSYNPKICYGINESLKYTWIDIIVIWSDNFSSGINTEILARKGRHIILPVEQVEINFPNEFSLFQNYPNPFNPGTTIKYQIPKAGNVTLKVYDVLGNEVATLVDEYKAAGSYEVEFQSTLNNMQLASGIYYYQLRVGEFVETKKMILLK